MKKHILWMITEYKRAAFWLPLAVKRAIICAIGIIAVACMIVFCIVKFWGREEALAKINVGYVADANILTQMAVSYVENMDAVSSICSLEKIESEDEGVEFLKEGRLSALVVLPEDVVDEINYGTNTHGILYIPDGNDVLNTKSGISNLAVLLFKEFASAGMGMLGTAQAEIYATYSLFSQAGDVFNSSEYDRMYNDIDRFNLSAVGGREDLFKVKNLSLTGNDTYAVYYIGAFLTIYLLITGLFCGDYCKRSYMEQIIAKKRLGVGFSYQVLCRCLAGELITIVTIIIPFAFVYIMQMIGIIDINITSYGIIAVLMATIFMTFFNMLIYEVSENRQAAIVIIGFDAILQSYCSGCVVPSVLLPDKIAMMGELLPASYIKKAFRILITGRRDDISALIRGLIIWSIIMFALTIGIIYIKQDKLPVYDKKEDIKATSFRIPTLWIVVLRRFLHKKSIWMSLILIAVASVLIVKTEKNSDTSIVVAYYDESGEYGELFDKYEGLVRFVEYGSEDEVRLAVLKDEVECGYIIPSKLTDYMLSQMSNGKVTVYQDDDAVAVSVVNEVIFERIFKNASLRWYERYIADYDESLFDIASTAVEEKLNEGITFDIDIRIIDGDADEARISEDESKATYPISLTLVLIVVICATYGIVQVISDECKKRFYRCKKYQIYSLTIIIPILFGILTTGIIIIAVFLLTS